MDYRVAILWRLKREVNYFIWKPISCVATEFVVSYPRFNRTGPFYSKCEYVYFGHRSAFLHVPDPRRQRKTAQQVGEAQFGADFT